MLNLEMKYKTAITERVSYHQGTMQEYWKGHQKWNGLKRHKEKKVAKSDPKCGDILSEDV